MNEGSGGYPTRRLADLLAPVRGALVLAVALRAVGSVAAVVPFIAVAEPVAAGRTPTTVATGAVCLMFAAYAAMATAVHT